MNFNDKEKKYARCYFCGGGLSAYYQYGIVYPWLSLYVGYNGDCGGRKRTQRVHVYHCRARNRKLFCGACNQSFGFPCIAYRI